jgi:hypothetical protein
MILVSGNYGFFNLLAIALCIPLFDDGVWPRFRRSGAPPPADRATTASWPGLTTLVWLVVVVASLVPTLRAFRWQPGWLAPVTAFYRAIAPFRVINSYGLFSVMTTKRDEIVIEGSDDGREWRPYEFRYKPGDPRRRPPFVAPHQPRLDWQMWFAALGDYRNESWFLQLAERILQGSPAVLGLLEHDPFPQRPPRLLRATLYRYTFTTPAQRRATGAWWNRAPLGPYCPVLTLVDGRLGPAP